ncbi:recombinase family protein [Streptomyces sp. IpFD-1.1]|uniref:recombinase family protein n=1 Tax=Streptomyces sp. IpFD-1.1 TaxID=2841664 RepID=UPI00209644E1|nr:recombinase family protein [Streptomyces sp. IpFD-1.1]MCO6747850.1 recombinase family protein [Streptomyces sp. IpFD-1.1]
MSNEQPHDDDQDVEPTVAEYTRADASKFPRTPAGQEAAVEGMAAAHGYTVRRRSTFERIADDLNRRGVPTDTPHGKIVTQMVELFNEFERETAADRARNGDTNPYDLEPYADVHDLAEQYDDARAQESPADLDRFLDDLAEDLDLADVKALRTAATAVAEAMGRIALAARERGMSPDRIASETGYTASRIAQFLREERERRGDTK